MALIDWRSLHGDRFKGVRCVVTGAAGFIGSHLCEALIELGAAVVGLDDLSHGEPRNVEFLQGRAASSSGTFSFHLESVTDASALSASFDGASFVFHQAAWGSVPASVEAPAEYHRVNTTGTLNVLEAARAAGVRRVVFAASSAAYGDEPTLPKTEAMTPRPQSPYAANKVAGEAMLQAWAHSYGSDPQRPFDTASLRYFNVFGPRQNANSAYAAVIAAFATALLDGRRPVIYGDGEQSRDFVYVDNVVHANLLAATSDRRLRGEPINIACGQAVTVYRLAERMAELLGYADRKPEHQAERAGDIKHSRADVGLALDRIGYRPRIGFDEGLAETLDWYALRHTEARSGS